MVEGQDEMIALDIFKGQFYVSPFSDVIVDANDLDGGVVTVE